MKQLMRWMLVVLTALPMFALAQVNSLPSLPHLLVKGQANRTVMPDRFSLTIALRAVDAQPDVARKRVQVSAEHILSAMKLHHVRKDSIDASSLQIQPSYSYLQDGHRKFDGSEVKRSIAGTFASLEDARQFLAELKTSSEVELSGITTSYSKEGEVRAQLKREAATQTRVSAEELAKAYGVRVQGLYTISDVAPNFAYGVQAGHWPVPRTLSPGSPPPPAAAALGAARVDALEAGRVLLSENIYAVFLIAQ
ncbi:SIMPL domain-containing protein [Xanthomonas melonis]|uniref:SIMPL domain-containing protein n=1 Tax=Xanthomonas melonis TaxID=56456 RepID=A0ABS8NTV8_9XANT|nr:SIMPL domain-containing protein [Xanthomonas melonis]MCD0245700.1 SIMPL domain-containing protein [Xanthomonas melonis]MCD0258361.1 SIMPL domain-containing protein [Xanthomonas melonis]MCD0266506.1 SIMPL domain-containing protein [Xanthomonas melonis]